ncbi:hypothetical protein BCR43DRAFT_523989 [Syncephalastrum racemosum]|uniref:RecQ-mediated genome instability protein 1 n=1 Tax=Syncephalastrum racemosum TaxID=13706 RepID=A0A1X2HG32_SYNRA|nr:hypothetical protein BCR43DRAFT_523989 [Syncephalastrum racemosum]
MEVNALWNALEKRYRIRARKRWIDAWLSRQERRVDRETAVNQLYNEFLNSDMAEISRPVLDPANMEDEIVLQIKDTLDLNHSALSLLGCIATVAPVRQVYTRRSNSDIKFPRGILRWTLTDGHNEILAIETKRIPSLELKTPFGCKIRVKRPTMVQGVLLLRPSNVDVLGGQVCDFFQGGMVNEIERRLKHRLQNISDQAPATSPVRQRVRNETAPSAAPPPPHAPSAPARVRAHNQGTPAANQPRQTAPMTTSPHFQSTPAAVQPTSISRKSSEVAKKQDHTKASREFASRCLGAEGYMLEEDTEEGDGGGVLQRTTHNITSNVRSSARESSTVDQLSQTFERFRGPSSPHHPPRTSSPDFEDDLDFNLVNLDDPAPQRIATDTQEQAVVSPSSFKTAVGSPPQISSGHDDSAIDLKSPTQSSNKDKDKTKTKERNKDKDKDKGKEKGKGKAKNTGEALASNIESRDQASASHGVEIPGQASTNRETKGSDKSRGPSARDLSQPAPPRSSRDAGQITTSSMQGSSVQETTPVDSQFPAIARDARGFCAFSDVVKLQIALETNAIRNGAPEHTRIRATIVNMCNFKVSVAAGFHLLVTLRDDRSREAAGELHVALRSNVIAFLAETTPEQVIATSRDKKVIQDLVVVPVIRRAYNKAATFDLDWSMLEQHKKLPGVWMPAVTRITLN